MVPAIYEFDDQFSKLVGWGGLTSEKEGSRRHGKTLILAKAIVKNDNAQRVEELPLVFVDAFYLGVKNVLRIDGQAARGL